MQGSSTNLTGSVPSLPDEGSRQHDSLVNADESTLADRVPVDHDSIITAKNLARVFSLEERLKQGLDISQDEFSSKIPQFLMEVAKINVYVLDTVCTYESMCVHEDEALLEEVMTEQVLRVVKALVRIRVVKACMIILVT